MSSAAAEMCREGGGSSRGGGKVQNMVAGVLVYATSAFPLPAAGPSDILPRGFMCMCEAIDGAGGGPAPEPQPPPYRVALCARLRCVVVQVVALLPEPQEAALVDPIKKGYTIGMVGLHDEVTGA